MILRKILTAVILLNYWVCDAQFQYDDKGFLIWRDASASLLRSEESVKKYSEQLQNYDALVAKGEEMEDSKDELKEGLAFFQEEVEENKAKLAKYNFKLPSDPSKLIHSTSGKRVVSYEIVTDINDSVVQVGSSFKIGVIATLENGEKISTKEFGGKNEVRFNFHIKVDGAHSDDKLNWQIIDMMYLRKMMIRIQVIDIFNSEKVHELQMPIAFNKSHVNNDLNNPMIGNSIVNLGKTNVFLISKRYQEERRKWVYFIYFISHLNDLQHFIVDEGETVTFNISSRIFDLDYDTKYFVVSDRKFDWSKVLILNILDGKTQRLTKYLISKLDHTIIPEDGNYKDLPFMEDFPDYKNYK